MQFSSYDFLSTLTITITIEGVTFPPLIKKLLYEKFRNEYDLIPTYKLQRNAKHKINLACPLDINHHSLARVRSMHRSIR